MQLGSSTFPHRYSSATKAFNEPKEESQSERQIFGVHLELSSSKQPFKMLRMHCILHTTTPSLNRAST